jgi:hypothetical protein
MGSFAFVFHFCALRAQKMKYRYIESTRAITAG